MTSILRVQPVAMRARATPVAASDGDDESRLVADLRGGRPDAAARLAELTYARLFAACHRITGRSDDAADLVQETYRKAWRALPRFRGDARFSTWLFRIAWTTHAKARRRPRLAVPLDRERIEGEPAREPSPETSAARSERATRLRQAVANLPEDLRYPVVARYWAELPVAEIAASVGITPMAVRKRLARAMRRLAATLEETTP